MAKNDSQPQQQKLVISDVIIVEILSCLPVDSILRFQCVSKLWHALISSSYFFKKQQSQAVSNSALFRFLVFRYPPQCSAHSHQLAWFNEPPPSPEIIDYHALKNLSIDGDHVLISRELDEFPDDLKNYNHYKPLMGSCNGLICLFGLIEEGTLWGDPVCNRIILWNPSTRKYHTLPELDNFRHPPFYGFGYDYTTKDYKVVLGNEWNGKIAIFALKTGSWRFKDEEPISFPPNGGENGYFLNGALHWLDYDPTIWAFDLADEKFHPLSFFSFPDTYYEGISTNQNHIYYYTYDDHHYSERDDALTLWVMMEYGVDESWTKILKIASKTLPLELLLAWTNIFILEDGEVLMKSSENDLIVLYDPKDETCRCVWKKAPDTPPIEVAMYEETLVSPITGSVPYKDS